ncbi:hypothetical protein GW846_03625 [Candidatus Gracilibacteria bacterium]|nr:hypothetical protein [Candidatus Gracilibacteria bacterium]
MKRKTTPFPVYKNTKIFFIYVCILISHFFLPQGYSFLGEDLGLDLYENIDKGLKELEQKQYEYELTGQGEAPIGDVIRPILAAEGIECDIRSSDEMETILGNNADSSIEFIVDRCNSTQAGGTPNLMIEKVQNAIAYTKSSYLIRAQEKTEATYEIARVGLYSDGNIENSPFDLIFDIQEIDRVIFSEEIEYEGEESNGSDDKKYDNFFKEDKKYLYDSDALLPKDITSPDIVDKDGIAEDAPVVLLDSIDDHRYMCPVNNSGLVSLDFEELYNSIQGVNGGTYVPSTNTWVYPDGTASNGASWGGPYPAIGPEGQYASVQDDWKCDVGDVFCIIIEFQKSQYGLAGGTTSSIEKVLSKVAKHLEKPANASLTQRKMTTNNFELGSIIKDLPGMLRGFGIEVSTKPLPILDLESGNENLLSSEAEKVENKVCEFYKNAGLDCMRKNDIEVFNGTELRQKIILASGGLPITTSENRNNQLDIFRAALMENNRQVSSQSNKETLSAEMNRFEKQFAELEIFLKGIEDFTASLAGMVSEMKKIPTRSS